MDNFTSKQRLDYIDVFRSLGIFNFDKLYDALINVNLGVYDADKQGHYFYERYENGNPDYRVNMPGKNDWGGNWYANYYLNDVINALLVTTENTTANLYANEHLNKIIEMQNRNEEGNFFAEGENNFVRGEFYQMHNLSKAYALKSSFPDGLIVN